MSTDPTAPAAEDARRLAEIRALHPGYETAYRFEQMACFLLRAIDRLQQQLDARPQGEFVTRVAYDAMVAKWTDVAERGVAEFQRAERLAAALAASQARVVELQQSEARLRAGLAFVGFTEDEINGMAADETMARPAAADPREPDPTREQSFPDDYDQWRDM